MQGHATGYTTITFIAAAAILSVVFNSIIHGWTIGILIEKGNNRNTFMTVIIVAR